MLSLLLLLLHLLNIIATRSIITTAFIVTMLTQTPGRIQQVDPPQGLIIYTIGLLESRIWGIYLLDLGMICTTLTIITTGIITNILIVAA